MRRFCANRHRVWFKEPNIIYINLGPEPSRRRHTYALAQNTQNWSSRCSAVDYIYWQQTIRPLVATGPHLSYTLRRDNKHTHTHRRQNPRSGKCICVGALDSVRTHTGDKVLNRWGIKYDEWKCTRPDSFPQSIQNITSDSKMFNCNHTRDVDQSKIL